jgi:serine protease Do/serine protease DegQ
VTSGIVSALGRTGLNIENYEDFIQTDAAINPGNSGGALVNLKGELVGINTAIIGPSGGNVGIGFAVPINLARTVLDQLLRFGEVRRGFAGIRSQDLTPALARTLKARVTEGALIADVTPKSPADRAGLRAGDIVTAVNGRAVRTSAELRNRVGLTPIGEEVRLAVTREGTPREVRVSIEDVQRFRMSISEALPELPGARLAPAPQEAGGSAIYVVSVERGSKAHELGLREGDLVLGVNGRRTQTIAELGQTIRSTNGALTLHLVRGESRVDLRLRRRA